MESLDKLEQKRDQLLTQIASLGPMRKGSLTDQYVETTRKDGSPTRRGPYTVYTYKHDGRTVSRRITDPARVAVYREQIAAFRRFHELTAELAQVSHSLADLEVSGQKAEGKKKLQALIDTEIRAEVDRLIEKVRRHGTLDLEAIEFFVRSAMLAAGGRVVEHLLQDVGVGHPSQPRLCARGHLPRRMDSDGVRAKTIWTLLGAVRFRRTRWVCPECGAVEYGGDELLGVEGTGFSPGLRRLMARAGSRESFAEAAADLYEYGGIRVTAKQVERVAESVGRKIDEWMHKKGSEARLAAACEPRAGEPAIPVLYNCLDGTGVPMRASETANTKGKGEDGKAKTREAKLGCVFTQTSLDEEGNPVRDPDSTTYVGAIETSVDFGHRLHAEAVRRGLARAAVVVVLCDGAKYNAAIAREHFPNAIVIIDLYHASEHLSLFIKEDAKLPCNGPFHRECWALLEQGQIEQLAERMRGVLPRSGPRRRKGIVNINYLLVRKEQMRYADFRRQGLFVGSGVIEAGCKTVIGKRLKQSGMFWTVNGANAIIAARCCQYSGRFEQFFEDTAA